MAWDWLSDLGFLEVVYVAYMRLVLGRFLGHGVLVKPVGVGWFGKTVYHV